MSWWLYSLLIGLGLALAAFVLYRAIGTGIIWDGIYRSLKRAAKAIFIAMLPGILKIFRPASTEELAKQDEGPGRSATDRFNKGSGRPFDRGKE